MIRFAAGESNTSTDEDEYQASVVRLANVSTFNEWILLLRYIVFYFEDRRSLVWDPSAQRQLLKILFLDPDQALYSTKREREILEQDTLARNMRAIIGREKRSLTRDQSRLIGEPRLRKELHRLEEQQRTTEASLDLLDSEYPDIEEQHEQARLRFLSLEQQRESVYRELEQAQLLAIGARLPRLSDSARYIFGHLLTDSRCLLCDTHSPEIKDTLTSRIRSNVCFLCESPLTQSIEPDALSINHARLSRSTARLQDIDHELDSAHLRLKETATARQTTLHKMQQLRATEATNAARLASLAERLPPSERDLIKRSEELSSLHARLAVIQKELDDRRRSFASVVAETNAAVHREASRVRNSFRDYAREFLLEDCNLVWSPRPARLGQAGRRFDFPAFELELGGSNFTGTVRRSGPEDVSQSQREFIDLSFRMALVAVATDGEASSLVMDAPESSLDAVFTDRAARILGRFANPGLGNRLVLTLNLVMGDLIPGLLREAAIGDDIRERVVDLFRIATPTAAVRELRDEYYAVVETLLGPLSDE